MHEEEDELKDSLLLYCVAGVQSVHPSWVQIDCDQLVTMVLVVELTICLHHDHCCGMQYRLQPDVSHLQESEGTLQQVDLTTAQDLLDQDLEMQALTILTVGKVLPNCCTTPDGEQDSGWVVLLLQGLHYMARCLVVVVVVDDRDSPYQTILPLIY